MQFEFNTSQAQRGILRVANWPDIARDPIREALRMIADRVRADAAASISPRGGRNNRSGAGSPPKSDSGALLRSLRTTLARKKRDRGEKAFIVAQRVGYGSVSNFYGFMLESGRRGMAARPFLVPAARRHVGEFRSALEKAIADSIQKAGA